MILTCNKCKEKFDDKYYIQNDNKQGFEEWLHGHIKKHEDADRLTEWFTTSKMELSS